MPKSPKPQPLWYYVLGRNYLPYSVLGLIYLTHSLMHWRGISCNFYVAERKASW